jgi:hypothetical protein
VFPHADAIAQDGSASEGAGGIDGDDTHGHLLGTISAREPVDQRALTGAGGAGDANAHCGAGVRKAAGKNLPGRRRVIFHQRNGPCQGAHVPLAKARDQIPNFCPSHAGVVLHPFRSYDW